MSTTASSPAGVPRVYLAVPTHSNTITVEAAITTLEFTQLAMQRGAVVQTVFYSASIISHLRNMIVADFLAGDFSHLFMLDADQGLPAPTMACSPCRRCPRPHLGPRSSLRSRRSPWTCRRARRRPEP